MTELWFPTTNLLGLPDLSKLYHLSYKAHQDTSHGVYPNTGHLIHSADASSATLTSLSLLEHSKITLPHSSYPRLSWGLIHVVIYSTNIYSGSKNIAGTVFSTSFSSEMSPQEDLLWKFLSFLSLFIPLSCFIITVIYTDYYIKLYHIFFLLVLFSLLGFKSLNCKICYIGQLAIGERKNFNILIMPTYATTRWKAYVWNVRKLR